MENTQEKSSRKKRKKYLINTIMETLEFYFSDANLSKDKFMQNLLNQDPFINIMIFHKFNKIKNLTEDTRILQSAVKNSDKLELSSDGQKVKRSKPLQLKDLETEKDCTIYIENLPPNSTRDWLKKVFSLYGKIEYISLPTLNFTGRPKGYSFIEFATPAEAQKALDAFGGGLAALDGTMKPRELMSIKTYNGDDNEAHKGEEDGELEEGELPEAPSFPPPVCIDNASGPSEDGQSTSGQPASKRRKMGNEDETKEEADAKKKKSKRRRNKKEKDFEPDSVYLRVLSKAQWAMLRNKYLNLQKDNMSNLKKFMHSYNDNEEKEEGEEDDEDEHCNLASYDLEGAEEGDEPVVYTVAPRPPDPPKKVELNFQPNVIIRISFDEPLADPKQLRFTLSQGRSDSIAYIDLKNAVSDVYVRFKTEEACSNFLHEGLYENMIRLSGEEEKAYWAMANASRREVHKECKKMKRGKDKLLYKADRFNQRNNPTSQFAMY